MHTYIYIISKNFLLYDSSYFLNEQRLIYSILNNAGAKIRCNKMLLVKDAKNNKFD